MTSKTSTSTPSISTKIRYMFTGKAKAHIEAPRVVPTISLPSRIPVRRKREASENSNPLPSPLPPLTRQRTDSSASVETIRPIGTMSSTTSGRAASSPTPPTFRPSSGTPLKSTLKKSTAPPSLNPGRASPTKAALTRSTSQNHSSSPLPSTRSAHAQTVAVSSKASSTPTRTRSIAFASSPRTPSPTRPAPQAASSKRTGCSGHEKSASDPHALRAPPASPTPAQLQALARRRPNTSSAAASGVLFPSFVSDEEEDDFIMLTKEDDELIRETRGRARRNKAQAKLEPQRVAVAEEPRVFTIPGEEPEDIIFHLLAALPPRNTEPAVERVMTEAMRKQSERLNRFQVYLMPVHLHSEVWDGAYDDVHTWIGVLYISDTREASPFAIPRLPIRDIQLDAHTVGFARDPDEMPEYSVKFVGNTFAELDTGVGFDPALGIRTHKTWRYFPPETNGAAVGGTWAVAFAMPVPMKLFFGRQSCVLSLCATVQFGAYDLAEVYGHSGIVRVIIDHLHSEEMGFVVRK